MIRSSAICALLAAATVGAGGCDRFGREQQRSAGGGATAAPAGRASVTDAESPATKIDPAPEEVTASRIAAQQDVVIAGAPACAFKVRYAGLLDQPATWRGEGCAVLTARFAALSELVRLGQSDKLDAAVRERLAELPGGRVFYVEGEHASAIFIPNEAGLLERTDLAD